MRLKKLAAALMLTTMCGSLLTGCGSGNDSASTGKDSKTDEKITATIKVWGPAEDQAEENGKWLQTMCESLIQSIQTGILHLIMAYVQRQMQVRL